MQIIARWENNKSSIPTNRLVELANFFKINIDYILELTNTKKDILTSNIVNKIECGKKIKTIREREHLTLRELASLLNTSSSTIGAYETGKTLILKNFLFDICKKYNYSADWILGRSEDMYIKQFLILTKFKLLSIMYSRD